MLTVVGVVFGMSVYYQAMLVDVYSQPLLEICRVHYDVIMILFG